MKILTKVIHRKSHFAYTRFEHFFKSLNSRTFDILKHVSRFPRPKITQKSLLQAPVYNTGNCAPSYYIPLPEVSSRDSA